MPKLRLPTLVVSSLLLLLECSRLRVVESFQPPLGRLPLKRSFTSKLLTTTTDSDSFPAAVNDEEGSKDDPAATTQKILPNGSVVNGVNGDDSNEVLMATTTPTAAAAATPAPQPKAKEQEEPIDSLEKFANDVKYVLQDLRGMEYDPYVPKHLIGRKGALTYSKTWTLDDWQYYNSRKRYYRFILNFPRSRLIRRVLPQLSALVGWALTTIWIDDTFFLKRGGVIPQIPLSALGTISTFLAFLLTLRSNQALSRLDEARRLWSKMILNTREMSNLISSFVYPVDQQIAIMLTRHVAIFGWLLKSQLRFMLRDEITDVVRAMLPSRLGYKRDADYILSQRQKTVAVITRIRQVIAFLGKAHKLTTAEEMALDHTAHALSEAITSTGRIRASPIPTLYTSHTSRLLIFYLFCLPAALHMSGLSGAMTILLSTVVGFAMMGLDEISHLFEQPFRVIPMYQMSKRSMLAVADALTCRPPPLKGQLEHKEQEHEEEQELKQKDLTIYWSKGDISSVSDNLME